MLAPPYLHAWGPTLGTQGEATGGYSCPCALAVQEIRAAGLSVLGPTVPLPPAGQLVMHSAWEQSFQNIL